MGIIKWLKGLYRKIRSYDTPPPVGDTGNRAHRRGNTNTNNPSSPHYRRDPWADIDECAIGFRQTRVNKGRQDAKPKKRKKTRRR